MISINTADKEYWFDEFTRYYYINKNDKLKQGLFTNYNEYLQFVKSIDYFETVYYNITKKCNMHCSYCYSKNENKNISLDENVIILQKLQQLNCQTISLIGGEPMIHPHFWEILDSIKKIKSIKEIVIITNGTLITENEIVHLKDSRITLQISLDDIYEEENAKTRGKGQLTKVLKALPILKKNNIDVRIMKVITKDSIKNAKRFFDFFYEKGIPAGFFMVKKIDQKLKPTIDQLRDLLDFLCEEHKMDFIEALDYTKFVDNMMLGNEGFPITHCGAGITSLSIHPDGNVYPCVKRFDETDYITNIYQNNAVDKIRENRQRIIDNELVDYKEKCSKCKIKYFCGGGCRAEEKEKTVCEYNCEYFEFALKYYAERTF